MRGITVCVEYDDLLSLTLPRNARHCEEILVVSSPTDARTAAVVATVPNARLFVTDAFYRDGAAFNKGLGLELGLEQLGREGWIVVWDADTLFPDQMSFDACQIGNLYVPPRRILENAAAWHDRINWVAIPLKYEPDQFPGYFQLFHARDPVLTNRPWYSTDWKHAGGCDSVFQQKWPAEKKHRLDFAVLHLGPDQTNWCGRVSDRLDGRPIPEAAQRQATLAELRRQRRKKRGDAKYRDERITRP